MKIQALVSAVLVGSAAAFAPAATSRSTTSLEAVDRRTAFTQIATTAAFVAAAPQIASADGAVSNASMTKAKIVYGSRIADLKSAVAAGDFAAVAAEKNAFILYNSGTYPGAKNKSKKAAAVEGTNAIFAAIRSKDAAGLKSAYDSYVAANAINPLKEVTDGQTFSSDFGYLARTKAASIYVR
mmetsp:Transcript_20140/g.29125  ORF Transcript_20140/g.29125 Transcript_20140/m.29125 type:complete len:183 (+) Transcript_20140:77-625(+)